MFPGSRDPSPTQMKLLLAEVYAKGFLSEPNSSVADNYSLIHSNLSSRKYLSLFLELLSKPRNEFTLLLSLLASLLPFLI